MNVLSQYLNDELEYRQEKNPAYSLRSFARDLSIDHSALSKIISGKRIPDIANIKSLLSKIDATEKTIQMITEMISKEKNIKNFKIRKPQNVYKEVSQTVFNVISNPNHYALLELLKTHNFTFSHEFISHRLNIEQEEVEVIIKNLEELKMIRIENNEISDLTDGFSTHEIDLSKTSKANKDYQIELLNRSIDTLRYNSIEERSHSAIVFATNKEKIYEAKGIIKKFRQSLCDFLEDTDKKTNVYALQVSLFPLTESEDNE